VITENPRNAVANPAGTTHDKHRFVVEIDFVHKPPGGKT
jgi:hypothetical protein